MESHSKQILETLRKNRITVSEADVAEIIKDLKDTKFSASDEEKGRAANLLKGLFFSEEEKAKKLISKLDAWFSSIDMKDFE